MVANDDSGLDAVNRHRPETVRADEPERLRSESVSPAISPEEVAHFRPPFGVGPCKRSDLPQDVGRAGAADDEAATFAPAILGEHPGDKFRPPFRADARGKVASDAPVGTDPVERGNVGTAERAQPDVPSAE